MMAQKCICLTANKLIADPYISQHEILILNTLMSSESSDKDLL